MDNGVRFKILPKNGKGKHVIHWCIYTWHVLRDEWVFVRSFLTEQRAIDHVNFLRENIAKGDYECLTLHGLKGF